MNTEHIPRGLLLQWHITSRCNLRCAHCYQDGGTAEELPLPPLLGILEQYETLLARWRAAAPRRRLFGNITVTGGEPFAHPDVWALLDRLATRRRDYAFALLTNGSFIDTAAARRLRSLKPAFVQVSVEGGPATHDAVRGRGDFQRVVAAIRALVRAKVATLISFTASRLNFREFPEVARLGRELGVKRVWADRLIPLGHGADLDDQMLTPVETRAFFHLMRGASPPPGRLLRPRTEIAMHRALQFLCGGGAPYRCSAGDSLVAVLPNGDLLPCRRMPIPVGNLLQTSLDQLYRESAVLRALRDHTHTPHGCEQCPYARICAGGLRCLAHAVHGDPFVADPGCWLARPATHAAASAPASDSRTRE